MNRKIGLLGKKLGMTQIYDEAGNSVPVTAVECGPCTVLQVKTKKSDGYDAVQLGFEDKAPRNVPDDVLKKAQGAHARYMMVNGRTSRAELGHFFKAGETLPKRFVRELRLPNAGEYEVGQQLKTDVFESGDFVDVVGTSKGHGFTGVIKRHGFSLFPKTHGTHEHRRHGGSIGCCKPMRTRKGQRMPGQDGNSRVTIQHLRVASILEDQNVVLIRGGIPGPNGGYVMVRKSIKRQKKS